MLNLWQKNEVFPTDVIQKVMALAPNPGRSGLYRVVSPPSHEDVYGGSQGLPSHVMGPCKICLGLELSLFTEIEWNIVLG